MNARWVGYTDELALSQKDLFVDSWLQLTETSLRCFMCPARLESLVRVYRDYDALLTGFLKGWKEGCS